jgi:serine/threonine protein kinase
MYFVMQYIQGMDLREELKREGRLQVPRITDIAKQLCGALAYAHEKRIVHRDIKTSNVMIKEDGSVMLMDFGLSKFVEETAGTKTSVSGTPYYMSPEQTLGEGVDYRTDIYSLGVMLYELATGRVPFTSGDIGYHHIHTEPMPPNAVNPDVPDSLSDIILKCMAKDKDARYQSAGEISKAFDFVTGKE